MKTSQDKFSLNDLHFSKISHPSFDSDILLHKIEPKNTISNLEDYFTFLEEASPDSVCEQDEKPQTIKPFKL